ncbi:hypothetical protein Tco_1183596 [Tanacetum coccineum]
MDRNVGVHSRIFRGLIAAEIATVDSADLALSDENESTKDIRTLAERTYGSHRRGPKSRSSTSRSPAHPPKVKQSREEVINVIG